MNALKKETTQHARTSLWISAIVLFIVAVLVIFCWHIGDNPTHPHQAFFNSITAMAYDTAVCLLIFSVALVALAYNLRWLAMACTACVFLLSCTSFIHLMRGSLFSNWLTQLHPANGSLMSITTATCLLLTSLSLFLISSPDSHHKNPALVVATFLNLVTTTIALVALLGHAVGMQPNFGWLGIKMVPHTAASLCLLSLALLIYTRSAVFGIFSRMDFFSRIVMGFCSIGVLLAVIGITAFMQIQTVSAITHKIYEGPLQINNTSLRIRSEIGDLTRQLKNMAIAPQASNCKKITVELQGIKQKAEIELTFIGAHELSLKEDTEQVNHDLAQWSKSVHAACELLDQQAYESFANNILYNVQGKAQAINITLEQVSLTAQQQITELNKSAEAVEEEAKKLIIAIMISFIIMGVAVAGLITRSLTGQLNKIRQAMLDIAQDKKETLVPFLDYPKDVGDMARTLDIFKDSFAHSRDLEMRLSQVIEAMPNGIIVVNCNGIIEIFNSQAEKIFGYERSELFGKHVEKLLPTNIAGNHPAFRDSFFKNPSPRPMGTGRELFGLRRDGSEFPLEIGLAPVRAKDGMKVLASVVDITERRNASIALDHTRERLELTTRINQIGLWEYIADEGKLIWNDAMFEIYGRKKEFFTADYKAWKQCVHPADLENTEKLLQESIHNLTPFICKFRIIQPDGTVRYIQAKAQPDRKADNNQLRVLGTNIDITREELAYVKLHGVEALRSAIVECSEDAIISKTPLGIVTTWNTGARNMFGYTAEEAIGRQIKDLLFPPDLVHQEDALLAQVRSGMVVKHFETLRRCKDGRLINVSITLSPIKDASGEIVGVSAIKRDITDSIKTAQMLELRKKELEHSNKELARSNKELETFAYVASHDLKSPLRGIAQLSTWIDEDIQSLEFEAVSDHTVLLRNRIQRMEKLLDDLLIFYRAGKADGSLAKLDIQQMVKDIFEIQNNKPGLRLTIKNDLPTITTLTTPLEQVMRNLLSNAVKHHDRPEGTIEISSRDAGDFIEFSVCDDGPGIPEKFHQRIFGMFQTLRPRDELEGSGMGLALIKKIIENYGGQINVRSQGRGSCFVFTWPLIINGSEPNDR